MANLSSVPYSVSESVRNVIPKSKVLVVGAGGIGCEVLKNLALSGFQDIEIIDLDTIDVSNLNRQFLFRKEHVGQSKAVVARKSILSYNPNINIKAYHDSITSQDYGVNFFKRFNLVLNALDNRAARNHVNRMCLAADVPLIESGTSGYSGQVELIKKGVTQCYECQPKPPQKTFPGCTIRNTPSEPVHCIVWAKHLFNQLFGEDDPDQDVSPDSEDPEAKIDGEYSVTETGNIKRTSTHQWVQEVDYDPAKLFDKFFKADIQYLLRMENLWKTRKPPVPLSWEQATSNESESETEDENDIRATDMKVWSLSKCAKVFASTITQLKNESAGRKFLVWDKDDKAAMDFVTACANIRAHIFSIQQKSRFEIKSIAGNIIPAIATANAMIAGLVVLHAFRVLIEEYKKCPAIYLRKKSIHSKFILAADKQLSLANPSCYVCSPKPYVVVFVNINVMTVKEFENELLKKHLNMVAPDVVLDGKGVVVISSEEGETQANDNKKLAELGIVDGSILRCDDFLQNYELTVAINHYEAKEKDDPLYKVVANPEELKAKESSNGHAAKDVWPTLKSCLEMSNLGFCNLYSLPRIRQLSQCSRQEKHIESDKAVAGTSKQKDIVELHNAPQESFDYESKINCNKEENIPLKKYKKNATDGNHFAAFNIALEKIITAFRKPEIDSSRNPNSTENEESCHEPKTKIQKQISVDHQEKNAGVEDVQSDSLYLFFQSMYNNTKNMPKVSQLRIKRQLFSAVQLEEEMSASSELERH